MAKNHDLKIQKIKFIILNYLMAYVYINSQAPDQKSIPQAPDRTYTSISVKTASQTFETATHVFAGAENHDLTLKFEIHLGNSQKLINFFSFF